MLILLSPAKNLNTEATLTSTHHTEPRLLKQATQVMQRLKKASPATLIQLMSISARLADLNRQRHLAWRQEHSAGNAHPAAALFRGDVYLGLKAWELNARELNWAQKHVRILSGLYGVLRPMDLIQPYRLEMGAQLKVGHATNLYDFWGSTLTDLLNQDLQTTAPSKQKPLIINLASNEYFAAVQPERLQGRLITPKFLEWRKDQFRFISFSAKRARGTMTNYIVTNKIKTLAGLKAFAEDGYTFNAEVSSKDTWAFTRAQQTPSD